MESAWLAHETRALVVEFPVGNQVLLGHAVIACTQPVLQVQRVSLAEFIHVEFDTQPGPRGNFYLAAHDLRGMAGEALTVLPDPVSIDGRDPAGAPRRRLA